MSESKKRDAPARGRGRGAHRPERPGLGDLRRGGVSSLLAGAGGRDVVQRRGAPAPGRRPSMQTVYETVYENEPVTVMETRYRQEYRTENYTVMRPVAGDLAGRPQVHGHAARLPDDQLSEAVHGDEAGLPDRAARAAVHGDEAGLPDRQPAAPVHRDEAGRRDPAAGAAVHGHEAGLPDRQPAAPVHGDEAGHARRSGWSGGTR